MTNNHFFKIISPIILISVLTACGGGGGASNTTSTKDKQEPLTDLSPQTKTFGDATFTLTVNGGSGSGTISYTSSNASVAIINATSNIVTIKFPGTTTITATKAGDNKYEPISATYLFTVNKSVQNTLTGLSDQIKAPNDGTFTPTVRGGSGNGAITYSTSNADVATVNTNSGEVTIKSSGTATITATKAGDNNYQPISTSYLLTVNKKVQNTLTELLNQIKAPNDGTFTLTASGGSGNGAISYNTSNSTVAIVNTNSGEVTIKSPGTTTITATKAGDNNYQPRSASYVLTVTNPSKSQQNTLTISLAQAKTFGDAAFMLTINGGNGNGVISYISSNPAIASVSPNSGTVTILAAGTTTITATKAGDTTYNPIIATYLLTINKSAQVPLVGLSAQNKNLGDGTFILSASGGSGSGAISYSTNNNAVATVNASSGEVTIKKEGVTTITATKAGDNDYNPTSDSYVLTVTDPNKQTQATLTISSVPQKTFGDGTFTLTVTGGSGTSTISYNSSNKTVATVNASGTVTILAAGSSTITATKAADNDYNQISDSYLLTINKKAQTSLIGLSNQSKTFGDGTFTLTASGGSSSGAISYSTSNAAVATVNATSGEVTIKGVGTTTITATKDGGANYHTISATYLLTVNKGTQVALTGLSAQTKALGDDAFTLSASGGSGSGAISYSSSSATVASVNNSGKVTLHAIGTITITATKAGDDNYQPTSASYLLTVTKLPAFTQRTGNANPFNGISVGDYSAPILADIDSDGDLDLLIGAPDGSIHYYKNTGDVNIANFVTQTVSANPFHNINTGAGSAPSLANVDIDGDGDLDLVIGTEDGTITYYKNTGDASNPSFTVKINNANPFNGINLGDVAYNTPFLADVDGDGDLDLLIGGSAGNTNYYKNIGSTINPSFSKQTGNTNPFNGIDIGNSDSVPRLVDNDGKLDFLTGERDGNIIYYKKTGSASSPTFTEQTGGDNPFDNTGVGGSSTPFLADIDNDGDLDLLIGNEDGDIKYYRNNGLFFANKSGVDLDPKTPGRQKTSSKIINQTTLTIGIAFDSNIAATIADSIAQIKLVLTGKQTGDKLRLGTTDIATNTNTATTLAGTVDGLNLSAYQYTYNATNILTITKTATSAIIGSNIKKIVEAVQLKNTAASPANGKRSLRISYIDDNDEEGISATASIVVDTIGPQAESVNAWKVNDFPTGQATFTTGNRVEVTLDLDQALVFEGTAAATIVIASKSFVLDTSASDLAAGKLLFAYTVLAGDYIISSDFDIDNINAIRLNGITDVVGNAVDLSTVSFPVELFSVLVLAEQTGSDNPFNSINVHGFNIPSLGDIDGDGDLDLLIGEASGTIKYYQNSSSFASTPSFTERTGNNNPLDGIDVGLSSAPILADIDGDGDLDLLIGEKDGIINYYQNTGSPTNPSFAAKTGTINNPFYGIYIGEYSTPILGDIDYDGDLDLLIGEKDEFINYYKNTGSKLSPNFVVQTNKDNPFNGFDVGNYSTPNLVDIDGDGDLDLVVGENFDNINYYQNSGSASNPSFVKQTGSDNPFYVFDIGTYNTPILADIDGDGDLDLVVGEYGDINYYQNNGLFVIDGR